MAAILFILCAVLLGGGVSFEACAFQEEASTLAHVTLDAKALSGAWGIPFIGLLLSIALLPLAAPRLWHRHSWKVALFWVLGTTLPLIVTKGWAVAVHAILSVCLHEYVPFITLILTLFTLSSGIVLRIPGLATPLRNSLFLMGAMLATNLLGTTGAAMLFIRPWLHMNAVRSAKTHLVIFFIILVGNLGGCLSALGDPPLFLGFLKGVPFFWPTVHLFAPFMFVGGAVLALFWGVDAYFFYREGSHYKSLSSSVTSETFDLKGVLNIILLCGAVGLIVLSGLGKPEGSLTLFYVRISLASLVRDGLLLVLTGISWRFTPLALRQANFFTWEPIKEVGILFFAIFITAMPVVTMLQAGPHGLLAPLFALVQQHGEPVNSMYFWLSGMLSAFLDNAPTYLVFFSLAGGDPVLLTGVLSKTLIAFSAGSVFMGALTYIGNAPNFMVKSIAEMHHIRMPGFFGYLAWASVILLPLFLLLTWIMFI